MEKEKWFTWTIEISFTEECIADGVDLTDDRVNSMVNENFPLLLCREIKTKIIKSPSKTSIRKVQGYKD